MDALALDGGTAVVNVIANGAGLSKSIALATEKGLSESQGALAAAGKKLTSFLTSPLTLIGAGAVGVVAKLGFEFEDAFQRIGAISSASAEDIGKWRDEVLTLAGDTAQAPKELANALFFLASAGLKTQDVIPALTASAKASAVGLGDTADVAKVVASAMNAYAAAGLTAANVTDTLVAAVREGQAEPTEFAAALGRILPIASAAGVSFQEVTASLSGLSNIGLDVDESVTAIRGALQAIVAPGTQAGNAMKQLGLSAQDLLDSIHQDGLLGAFELLKTRAEAVTTTQADYLGVLRKVIPNIRGLTGVLGLSGDALAHNKELFDQVSNSAGDLNEALATTEQSPSFQFTKALNNLRVTGTELGIRVLPAITSALEAIAPLLEFAAKNALALLAAFVTFKTFAALPSLMLKLGASLLSVGEAGQVAGTGLIAAGTAMTGLTAATAGATLGIGLLALAISQNNFGKAIEAAMAPAIQSTTELAQAADLSARSGLSFADALAQVRGASQETAQAIGPVNDILDKMRTHLTAAGNEVKNFAGLSNKDLKKFRDDTISNFSSVAGTITDTGATFTLTAKEVIRGVNRMAEAQQRMAQDLAKLDDLKIGDKLKKRLIELGPEAVDGFVRGTEKQRGKIRQGLKAFDQGSTDTAKAVDKILGTGGQKAAQSMTDGMVAGIRAGIGPVVAAAITMGNATIAGLKAALAIKSPSGEAEKIGFQVMQGLVLGMTKNFKLVTEALRNLVPEMRKAIGQGAADQTQSFLRDLEALDKRFERLKTRIGNFKSAIRGAFTDASDLIGTIGAALEQFRSDQEQFLKDQQAFIEQGPEGTLTQPVAPGAVDIKGLLAAQVAQAKQLADLLKQLQKKGLNVANLTDLAGQGAAGIPIAQALLDNPQLINDLNSAQENIAAITQSTADKMTAAAFGDKVLKLSNQVDRMLERLQAFIQGLGLTTDALKKEEQAFIDALRKLNNALAGVGVPGGTVGEGGGQGNNSNVTVNVNVGPGVDAQGAGRAVRDALLQLQRRNVTTGL